MKYDQDKGKSILSNSKLHSSLKSVTLKGIMNIQYNIGVLRKSEENLKLNFDKIIEEIHSPKNKNFSNSSSVTEDFLSDRNTIIRDNINFQISRTDSFNNMNGLNYLNYSRSSSLGPYSKHASSNNSKINQNHLSKSKFNYLKETKIFNNSNDQIFIDNISHHSEVQATVRVLIVEDEKLIRNAEFNAIKKFFIRNNANYEIVKCEDGVECLSEIYKGIQNGIRFDYILTDETMNLMRGSLLIKTIESLIHENVLYPIKISMVTSYESSTIINNYGSLVQNIYTKPLTHDHIINIFKDIIYE